LKRSSCFLKVDTTEEGIEVNANSNSLRGDTKAMSCELTDGGGGGGGGGGRQVAASGPKGRSRECADPEE